MYLFPPLVRASSIFHLTLFSLIDSLYFVLPRFALAYCDNSLPQIFLCFFLRVPRFSTLSLSRSFQKFPKFVEEVDSLFFFFCNNANFFFDRFGFNPSTATFRWVSSLALSLLSKNPPNHPGSGGDGVARIAPWSLSVSHPIAMILLGRTSRSRPPHRPSFGKRMNLSLERLVGKVARQEDFQGTWQTHKTGPCATASSRPGTSALETILKRVSHPPIVPSPPQVRSAYLPPRPFLCEIRTLFCPHRFDQIPPPKVVIVILPSPPPSKRNILLQVSFYYGSFSLFPKDV